MIPMSDLTQTPEWAEAVEAVEMRAMEVAYYDDREATNTQLLEAALPALRRLITQENVAKLRAEANRMKDSHGYYTVQGDGLESAAGFLEEGK